MKKNLLIFLLAPCFIVAQTISEKFVKQHIYTLSNDSMQGRKAGTNGIEKAAKYIESEFKRIGLKSFNSDSFRQEFRFVNPRSSNSELLILSNVIGLLEGSKMKNEYVIISAHYDHLGKKDVGEGDLIFNGANDNASGVAAVLMLAEYFKKANINKRSLLFVAFTAEEIGLVGSNYFGKTISPDSIVAGINIEMIGKESPFGPNSAWLTGFERSNFGTIIQKNLSGSNYKLYPDPYNNYRLFFRSDNASLARLGIPAHTFSTSPMDKDLDYHKVTDEARTLNIETITQTIKAIAIGTESIITGEDTPTRVKL